eukprot:2844105-Amphidinium_carterae.1
MSQHNKLCVFNRFTPVNSPNVVMLLKWFLRFREDIEAVLVRASKAGVVGLLACSTSPSDIHD